MALKVEEGKNQFSNRPSVAPPLIHIKTKRGNHVHTHGGGGGSDYSGSVQLFCELRQRTEAEIPTNL